MKKTLQFYCVILFALNSFHAFSMNLFVQTPNNETISLDVVPSDSIENVKSKITDAISNHEQNQLLSLNGSNLNKQFTLADWGMSNNTTFLLTDLTATNNTYAQFSEKLSFQ